MLETTGRADIRQEDFRQLYNCPDVDIRTVYRNAQEDLTNKGVVVNLLSTITTGTSSIDQVSGQYLGLFNCQANVEIRLLAATTAGNRDFYPVTVILAQSISPKVPGVNDFWGENADKTGTAGSVYAPLGSQNWSARQDYKIIRRKMVLLQKVMLASAVIQMNAERDDFLANCVEFDDKTDKGANINTGALFLFAISPQVTAAQVQLRVRSRTVGFIPT